MNSLNLVAHVRWYANNTCEGIVAAIDTHGRCIWTEETFITRQLGEHALEDATARIHEIQEQSSL